MMKITHALMVLVLIGLAGNLYPAGRSAPSAVEAHAEMTTAPFQDRWHWAIAKARTERRGGWVGYAVDLWMEPDSYMISGGNYTIVSNGQVIRHGQSLADILGDNLPESGSPGVLNQGRTGDVRRTLAVLMRFNSQGKIDDVRVTDISFPTDLEVLPLAWIGAASADEGFRLVTKLYAKAENRRVQEDLVDVIGLHDRAEAVDFLAGILDSNASSEVREEAAESLADQSDPRSVDILVRVTRSDDSFEVREEAVEALGDSRTPGARQAVFDLVRGDAPSRLRQEAVEVLAVLWHEDAGRPEALETLTDILWNDRDVKVQEEAVEAFGDLPNDISLPILIKAARHHPQSAVREEAVEALAAKAGDKVVGTLEDIVYEDENHQVREEALDALGELAGDEGLAILVKVASTHPDTKMREEALDALVDAGEDSPRARRALLMLGSS